MHICTTKNGPSSIVKHSRDLILCYGVVSSLTHEYLNVFQMCYNLVVRLRKHIVLRIDEKSLKAVQRIAKQEDESVARIIRRAIASFVREHKRK